MTRKIFQDLASEWYEAPGRVKLILVGLAVMAVGPLAVGVLTPSVERPDPALSADLTGPFERYDSSGFAFKGADTDETIKHFSDNVSDPYRSPLALYENNLLLGPSHSRHRDIVEKGRGRFSHWEKIGFIFSTSDNSDPNTNGRKYRVAIPKY